MALQFITGNKGKYEEIKAIFEDVEQVNMDLPEIQDIDPKKIIEAKLKAAVEHAGGSYIVEDTSLYLDALPGLPGPLIKWFDKTIGNQGLFDIAEKFENYGAEAKVYIGYINSMDSIEFFEGSLRGTIVSPRGDKGFGWDAIFQPEGFSRSFGEMEREEKNKLSMRAQAALKLRDYLQSNGR